MNQLPVPPALFPDLEQVETILRRRLETRPIILRIAGPGLLAGNPRIRVVLTLLAAQLGRYNIANVLHAAAAVELIHAATLVHNQLVDAAARRRGGTAVQRAWNGSVDLMVGDYLFALAASEMALAPDPRIIAYFSRAVMAICEGALAPVMTVAPLIVAVEQYLYNIGSRTAALFEAAGKAGMVCGGGTQEQIDALGQFGYNLGIAYQIIDDVLDYTGSETTRDRETGADLRNSLITLPLIYAMEAAPSVRLAAVVETPHPDEESLHWAIGEVRRTEATGRALADARAFVERAIGHLQILPDTFAKAALIEIARSIVAAPPASG